MKTKDNLERIFHIEDILTEKLGYEMSDLQLESGIIDYFYQETLNDLTELGIDVKTLDTDKYFGYHIEDRREVTASEYLNSLKVILTKEIALNHREIAENSDLIDRIWKVY